jgi:hypothetical protein
LLDGKDEDEDDDREEGHASDWRFRDADELQESQQRKLKILQSEELRRKLSRCQSWLESSESYRDINETCNREAEQLGAKAIHPNLAGFASTYLDPSILLSGERCLQLLYGTNKVESVRRLAFQRISEMLKRQFYFV